MGSATPGQAVLSYAREQAEETTEESKPVSSSSMASALVPAL